MGLKMWKMVAIPMILVRRGWLDTRRQPVDGSSNCGGELRTNGRVRHLTFWWEVLWPSHFAPTISEQNSVLFKLSMCKQTYSYHREQGGKTDYRDTVIADKLNRARTAAFSTRATTFC